MSTRYRGFESLHFRKNPQRKGREIIMSLEVNLLLIDEENNRTVEASCPAIGDGQEPRQWIPDKIVGNWDTILGSVW